MRRRRSVDLAGDTRQQTGEIARQLVRVLPGLALILFVSLDELSTDASRMDAGPYFDYY